MSHSKMFTEYLLENSIVTEDAIVSVLVDQLKTSPTVCEILYKNKLMSPKDMFKALVFQSKNGVDFIAACKQLGLWSDHLQVEINKELDKHPLSIIQSLVQEKHANLEALTKALDAYLADCKPGQSSPPAPSAPQAAAPQTPPPASPPSQTPLAASSPLSPAAPKKEMPNPPQTDISSPSFSISQGEQPQNLDIFFEQFEQATKQSLISLLDEIIKKISLPQEPPSAIVANLKQTNEIIHRLGSVCRFSKLIGMQKFFEQLETTILAILNSKEDLHSQIINSFSLSAKEGVEVAWQLRETLMASNSRDSVTAGSVVEEKLFTSALEAFKEVQINLKVA